MSSINSKNLGALIIAFVFVVATGLAQEKAKLPSREDVLNQIEVFAQSPLSTKGIVAAGNIVKFAEESDEVLVVISPSVVPWVVSEKPPKLSEVLLAAYIAGNVQAQLTSRKNGNNSYAGIQQVIKTYAQLKESDKTLDIPEIQTFADLEAKKDLKKYLDEAVRNDNEDTAK